MRKSTILTLAAFIMILFLALAQRPATAAPDSAVVQKSGVMWHAQSGSGAIDGARAKLLRTDHGISYLFQARALKPGNVYTMWFVAVNDPSPCSATPCPGPELIGNSATASDVIFGGSSVVAGEDGAAVFSGNLPAGAWSNSWLGNGLISPYGAEIHLVLNDHGPAIPDILENMLHSYRGGCTDASLPPFFPATAFADGIPGPNNCRLYQVAVFQP